MDRQALSLPPSGAFYRGGGRSYLTLYLRQVLAQLWKTSYRLRWWLGVWLSLIGSGALGGMPLWVLLLLVSVAAVGTLMVLGGVRGVRFDPVFIESLWARYAALPYNPWRILRDRPVAPHPLWDAHRAWAHDVLRGVRLPKIPAQILWQWEPPTRIELAAVAVVGLLVTVGPGSVRDITTPLSQIAGITQAPPLAGPCHPARGLGLSRANPAYTAFFEGACGQHHHRNLSNGPTLHPLCACGGS